jgi:hypothetical protein
MDRNSLIREFAKYYPKGESNINIIHYAEPNRLGVIALVEITANSEELARIWWGDDYVGKAMYIVTEELHYGDDDRYIEPIDTVFSDKLSAERYYNELLDELLNTPNRSAQEEYDREHGTINGYDPNILEWNNLIGEG